MNRVLVTNFCTNGVCTFLENKERIFAIIDGSLINETNFSLKVGKLVNLDLLLINLKEDSNIDIVQEDGSICNVEAVFTGSVKNFKITANLNENTAISGYFADFSVGDVKSIIDINLNGVGAEGTVKIASLSAGNDHKEFATSIYHNSPRTTGLSDCYGVSKDDGKLIFSGVSKIEKNSKLSKTVQNAKIMVFDALSQAVAKPILKIDENEIEASHAATVGKVSDEEMFYLTSRGLSKETAKELITLGYLKPIVNGFSDEEVKNIIFESIERRM